MSSFAPHSSSPLSKNPTNNEESFMERWLVVPKILYFMLNVFVYSFHGVMGPLFTDDWKFPQYLYAYATSVIAANFFGALLWTSLADRTGKYKAIIIVSSTLYSMIAIPMATMYKAPLNPGPWDYVKVFMGFGLWNFFLSAAFPLLDAQILGMLAKNPKLSKEQFGNQRMFGAVGHFVSTLLSFLVYKNNNRTAIFNILAYLGFVLSVAFGISDVKVAKGGHHGHAAPKTDDKGKDVIRSPSPMPMAEGVQQVPLSQAIAMAPSPAPPCAADELSAEGGAGVKHPVIALFTNPSFMFFMVFVTGMGTVRSVTSSFQKIIMADLSKVDPSNPSWLAKMGFPPLLEKNFMIAAVDFGRMISEIVVYMYAKQMKNLMGIYWILVLSQLVGIFRMYGYGVLPTGTWYAYYGTWGLELVKGFSSGMVSSSAIPIASRIAPAGCESTAQGLFSGNYSGLSNAIAGVISGRILQSMYVPGDKIKEKNDVQSMFCWVSLGTVIVTIAMTGKFVFIDRVMGLPGFPRKHSMPS